MDNFKLNDRVIVIGKHTKGKIAFMGETRFAEGEMCGVILDEPKGKYSGTIGDVCYFKCPNNHAIFVRACQLEKDIKSCSEDRIAPVYPKDLKDNSSRHKLKTIQKCEADIEIANHKKNPSKNKSVLDHQKTFQEVKVSNACSKYIFTPVYPDYLKENSSKHKIKVTPKLVSKDKIANQPKKTSKLTVIDHMENPKKGKDNNSSSKGLIAPVTSNYLKDSNSKHVMKIIPKRETKEKFANHEKKPTKSSVLDHSVENFKQPEQEKYQLQQNYRGDDVKFNKVCEIKNNYSENLEIKMQNLDKDLSELSTLKQKLYERNEKIETIHIYLRKLKTYMKWSQHIKKSSSDGDSSIENFIRLLVDSVLKQMEDNVDQISNQNQLNLTEESSTISEENNFLRLYVDALEKRNEVLFDSLKYARNILQRALIRSRSKKKCSCVKTPGGEVEIECKYCLSKLFSTIAQSIEHETQLFLESNPIKNDKTTGYSTKELGEFEGSEKLEKYLESLLARQAPPSTSENDFQEKSNAETFDNQDLQCKSALDISIPRVSQSATETDVSIKNKNFSRNYNRNAKNQVRSTSLSSSRKAEVNQSQEKRPAKANPENLLKKQQNLKKRPVQQITKQASVNSLTDPKKDYQELNSEVKPGIFHKNKLMEGGLAEDILIIPMNKATEEKLARLENKNLNRKLSSKSQTEVAKSMKPSLNSGKFKCERRTKRSRSESTVRVTKKEPFKF
ncbi:hypothetical protein JTE90_029058 [Oedothorax gibbosus]|uniref:CAP-Gly domain-containing protein n=1 Tax=Oedothorax gibbosus TaxID=931172 RepID=A0AAV6UUG3_9ARAC|nr:hypothetical protein JTE90_029058 [Oedothorax gibbosus]